jgi:hypothetical protein
MRYNIEIKESKFINTNFDLYRVYIFTCMGD